MKLIVGLGNPGSDYRGSRHNAGFMAVERVAKRHAAGAPARSKFNSMLVETQVGSERVLLMQPLTYMNRSGDAISQVVNFYKLSPQADVLVLVDEYQLPLGSIRIRTGGGSGGHNGLTDVERALGTQDYPRLRIGVDAPPATYNDPADWVLGWFTPEQLKTLEPALERAADAVEAFITKGLAAAMNTYNADPSKPPRPKPERPPVPPNRQPPTSPGDNPPPPSSPTV
jgi:peptidyl-tRNA hydrolase, PTH1 family